MICFLINLEKGSCYCSPHLPQTHDLDLPQPLKYLDYRHVALCLPCNVV